MTAGGLLTLLLYSLVLTALAAFGAGLLLWPLARRLPDRVSPLVSSGFWFSFAMAPVLVGLAVGGASFSSGLMKGWGLIADHCRQHPGHPHLCWVHGDAAAAGGLFFWAALAGATGLLFASSLNLGRSLHGLNRSLRNAKEGPEGFLVVPSQAATAFVAGLLKPRIYLTTKALQLLTERERRIVAFHEREHLRRRDPIRLALLRMSGSLFPGFEQVEREWKNAVEIECDWACLREGVTVEEVSMTILKLARSSQFPAPAPILGYAVGRESFLKRRISRLVSGVPPRQPSPASWALAVLAILFAAGLLSSEHHSLETILGTFIN